MTHECWGKVTRSPTWRQFGEDKLMKSTFTRPCAALMAPLAIVAAAWLTGCSPAYHSYGDCAIDCKYCPAPPLPWMDYQGCACHACAVEPYLHAQLRATGPVRAADPLRLPPTQPDRGNPFDTPPAPPAD